MYAFMILSVHSLSLVSLSFCAICYYAITLVYLFFASASEMIYIVSGGVLNSTLSLSHSSFFAEIIHVRDAMICCV